MTVTPMPPWTPERAAAIRLLVEAEVARALDGDEPMQRRMRGEDIDLGHPQINSLVDRTAARLYAIPDLIVPRIAEARSEESIRFMLDDAIRSALSEMDTAFGF